MELRTTGNEKNFLIKFHSSKWASYNNAVFFLHGQQLCTLIGKKESDYI